MKPALAIVVLALFALTGLAPRAFAGGDDAPSPVGRWSLDREGIESELKDDRMGLLASVLVLDIDLEVFEDGRFETRTKREGETGEGHRSGGTWTQSGDVVSLAAMRDDGHPGSVVGRLVGDRLVLDFAGVKAPLVRVGEDEPTLPTAPEETKPPKPSIGLGSSTGPDSSIRLPHIERDDGTWPPATITSANHRRVARRTGEEVVRALAKELGVPPAALWKDVDASRVIHVESARDRIEPILNAWKLPHITVTPLDFMERGPTLLESARVVLVPSLPALPRALESGLAAMLRAFVERGGYVATTGCSVETVLVPAFPTLVRSKGSAAPMDEMSCTAWVTPASVNEKALVRGLPQTSNITLWCDAGSYEVEGLGGAATPSLVASNQPHLRHQQSGVLLLAASTGDGKVLHAVPKVDQRRGTPSGAHTLQRILLNFVHEALTP